MKCTKKPQISQQPVVEAKIVKKKYRLKKKKKAAAPSKAIDESMYIDDGRYKGPDEIRNAAFKLHRMYLQKCGLDISKPDEQVDEENLKQQQQRLEAL